VLCSVFSEKPLASTDALASRSARGLVPRHQHSSEASPPGSLRESLAESLTVRESNETESTATLNQVLRFSVQYLVTQSERVRLGYGL
jgi:hypothetical protein